MKRLNESGRTLVEMLGVLAIIGILSVVGLVGYRLATNKMWANTLIHEAQKRAVVVAGQIGFGQPVDLANFTENTFNGTIFDTKIYTPSGALWTNVNPQFALKLSDVQTDVCAEMKKISTRTQVIQSITDDCGLIVYNNDLSEAKCEENAVNGSCQKCVASIWTNMCATGQRCVNTVCVDAPEGYTQVEYLESTGTQYIDLNYVPKMNTGVKGRVEFTDTTPADQYLIGSRDDTGNTRFWFGCSGPSADITRRFIRGNVGAYEPSEIPVIANKASDFSFNYNGDRKTYWDGQVYTQTNATTFTPTRSWYLFAPNYQGEATATLRTYTKLYFLQIYEGTTLVRDFIPVLDNDNVPCLYDKVSGQCFYNAGTGDFIAGPEIAPLLKD